MSETPHSADWFRSLGTDERVPLALKKLCRFERAKLRESTCSWMSQEDRING